MNTRTATTFVVIAVFVLASSLYLNSQVVSVSSGSSSAAAALSELSEGRYAGHVAHLAAPAMQGRGNGTPELEAAANYVASQFERLGLKPAGEKGTYFQTFAVTTGSQFGPNNSIRIGDASLKLNDDFVPLNFSGDGEVEAPVVFVGYGMTAPEMHWDEYKGVDAKGKIVVALRHEPQELDPKSLFAGTNFTAPSSFINKAINAKQHGALGIVFITDPLNHETEEDRVGEATRTSEIDDSGIPAAHARREPVMAWFSGAGKDLKAIQKKIDTDLEPQSFEAPNARFRVSTQVVRTRKPVRNVIGMVEGSDPALKHQWIVVGAHYDHLGLGSRSSLAPDRVGQIHHGADDNASGTSGVLELARVISKNRRSLGRSVLLMTFAGEELGLLGSAHFVNNPTIPIGNVTAMVNMDMIGRLSGDKLYVGGVGTSPNFRPWVEEFNKSSGLTLDYSDSGYGSSDHTSFTIKSIPVLFFFSGLHSDYHKPSDTAEKINAAGARKVLSLVYLIVDRLSTEPERQQFTRVDEQRPTGSGGGGGYGPYFGSIPDFGEGIKGVKFADVRPGSPAAKAGLKTGDIMTSFDGQPIQNLYDFTFALRGKKPGDVVVVIVLRGNEELKVDVTLEARR